MSKRKIMALAVLLVVTTICAAVFIQSKKDIVVVVGDLSRMERRESILYLMNNLQNDSMMPKVYFVVCRFESCHEC